MQAAKDAEIEQLHQRVKAVVTKKDETIATLRDQYDVTLRRANRLEELLQSQRRQVLGK